MRVWFWGPAVSSRLQGSWGQGWRVARRSCWNRMSFREQRTAGSRDGPKWRQWRRQGRQQQHQQQQHDEAERLRQEQEQQRIAAILDEADKLLRGEMVDMATRVKIDDLQSCKLGLAVTMRWKWELNTKQPNRLRRSRRDRRMSTS